MLLQPVAAWTGNKIAAIAVVSAPRARADVPFA